MTTNTGTLFYKAPEMFKGGSYTESVDMFAIGVITFQLLTGRLPFQSQYVKETIESIVKCEYSFQDCEVSENARQFINKLLVCQQLKRMTANECLFHPWLKGLKEQKQEEHYKHRFPYQDEESSIQLDEIDSDQNIPLTLVNIQSLKEVQQSPNFTPKKHLTVVQIQNDDDIYHIRKSPVQNFTEIFANISQNSSKSGKSQVKMHKTKSDEILGISKKEVGCKMESEESESQSDIQSESEQSDEKKEIEITKEETNDTEIENTEIGEKKSENKDSKTGFCIKNICCLFFSLKNYFQGKKSKISTQKIDQNIDHQEQTQKSIST